MPYLEYYSLYNVGISYENKCTSRLASTDQSKTSKTKDKQNGGMFTSRCLWRILYITKDTTTLITFSYTYLRKTNIENENQIIRVALIRVIIIYDKLFPQSILFTLCTHKYRKQFNVQAWKYYVVYLFIYLLCIYIHTYYIYYIILDIIHITSMCTRCTISYFIFL